MPPRKRKAEPWMPRLAQLHARLLVSIALGIAVTLALLGTSLQLPTKLLIAWDAGVVLYLVWTLWMMASANVPDIRSRAAVQDEGATAMLILSAAAGLASLAAIVAELGDTAQTGGAIKIALGMVTIILSWLFTHTIFALHYAHEFYGDRGAKGGMKFPGEGNPDYWDFFYFSFVIAMTSQVSDVAVTGKPIRRLVNLHGMLAFLFNFSVVALMVNILSSLLKPGG